MAVTPAPGRWAFWSPCASKARVVRVRERVQMARPYWKEKRSRVAAVHSLQVRPINTTPGTSAVLTSRNPVSWTTHSRGTSCNLHPRAVSSRLNEACRTSWHLFPAFVVVSCGSALSGTARTFTGMVRVRDAMCTSGKTLHCTGNR
jgi:hypothetical protein